MTPGDAAAAALAAATARLIENGQAAEVESLHASTVSTAPTLLGLAVARVTTTPGLADAIVTVTYRPRLPGRFVFSVLVNGRSEDGFAMAGALPARLEEAVRALVRVGDASRLVAA